jgi:DNA-binding transcriptional LysR family regulator
MMLDDEDLDLSKREADVAIRFHPPLQAELVQKPLYAIRHFLCASPDYLARHGAPQSIADLDAHRLIAYGDAAPDALKGINWALSLGHQGAPRKPTLTINNSHAVLQAVEAGAGIAALPTYLIRFSGRVQIVLPAVEGPVFQTYFTYPVELRRSLRVAALRDFLTSRMRTENLDIDRHAILRDG